MVLMPDPTNVSSVGPATRGERVYFSYTRRWKNGNTLDRNCTYPTVLQLPGITYKINSRAGGLNLAPCGSGTYIPDYHARALFRNLLLLLKYSSFPSAYSEKRVHLTIHHRPYCAAFTVELLSSHRLWGTCQTKEAILNCPVETPLVSRRHASGSSSKFVTDAMLYLATRGFSLYVATISSIPSP